MIVIARKYGQLGNRLFLFSHLIAAARHYGVELRNPCFAEYADLFNSTRHDLWCRYDQHLSGDNSPSQVIQGPETLQGPAPRTRSALMQSVQVLTKSMYTIGLRNYPAKLIRLRSNQHCDLEGDQFRSAIESGRTLLLQGWLFRSNRLLEKHWRHIRDYFTIPMADQAAIASTITGARRDCDVLVGVHIRRGDYADFLGGRYYYDDALYARWMRGICEQIPGRRVRFLVCSHEKLDTKQYAGLDITRGPGSAIRDMYALAETDWMIGPPSTFTAWAAFVGRKPRVELQSKQDEVLIPDPELPALATDRIPCHRVNRPSLIAASTNVAS